MKIRLIKTIFICLTLFSFISIINAETIKPTGFVNDTTGTLSAEQKQSLENKLSQFEKETGNEIAVVLINSLDGDSIENYANELFKDWGIGKKGKDNGVLVLVAKNDREMRIEVGYGLEGALTDAQSNWIINDIIKPNFKNNDFNAGLNGAVDKIISATKGEVIPSLEKNTKISQIPFETILMICLFVFVYGASILGRSKSWWLGGVVGGIVGVVIGLIKGFLFLGIISIVLLIPFGLLFDYIVSKKYKEGKESGHMPWWIGGGGHGGGGGGFGGFGGGMSGGGGSSGSW